MRRCRRQPCQYAPQKCSRAAVGCAACAGAGCVTCAGVGYVARAGLGSDTRAAVVRVPIAAPPTPPKRCEQD
eukprot:2063488-Pyramimonas_sp.AAC.1